MVPSWHPQEQTFLAIICLLLVSLQFPPGALHLQLHHQPHATQPQDSSLQSKLILVTSLQGKGIHLSASSEQATQASLPLPSQKGIASWLLDTCSKAIR